MKWIAVIVLAFVLALGVGARGWIVVPSQCANLTPENWFLWWLYDCGRDTAGGGGGGAS